jgi:hypothetical protein
LGLLREPFGLPGFLFSGATASNASPSAFLFLEPGGLPCFFFSPDRHSVAAFFILFSEPLGLPGPLRGGGQVHPQLSVTLLVR